MAKKQTKTYSVTEANTLVRLALEEKLPPRMTIAGQISDWNLHYSGHCYFSLKDENSQLPCVMWASKFKNVKFAPENGLAVMATGHIELYVPLGKYQFYCDSLQPAGTGALQLAFEQMVKRLRAEGLFDPAHKKPLPAYPMRIGVVTSQSGAAIADITDSITTRWPCARILLFPAPVQGPGAAEEIAKAIRQANSRNRQLQLDILIVGRGGGSLEDLWAFNEEPVARAIFASKIPVISAVGHEVDITIADLVADKRASTPTNAGVIAVPDAAEVLASIDHLHRRLSQNAAARLDAARRTLDTICASALFRNPLWIVNNASQLVDEKAYRLADSARTLFARLRGMLEEARLRIERIEPHRLLGRHTVSLTSLGARMLSAAKAICTEKHLQLTASANRLEAMNPRAVLERGYSITTSVATGRLITCADDTKPGEMIRTELAADNAIESEVKTTHKPPKT